MSTGALEAYQNNQIEAADPVELICLLYQGALDAVQQARRCLREKDIMGRSRQITKAMEIVGELSFALDPQKGGELASGLAGLYAYIQQRLTEANIQQAEPPLAEVESLLGTLFEGWQQSRADAPSAPVTSHAYAESAPVAYTPVCMSV
jgi:flagellar secretion chaperone FliS